MSSKHHAARYCGRADGANQGRCIDKIMFAWSGAIEKDQQYQYLVQGPTFLIEHDNTQTTAVTFSLVSELLWAESRRRSRTTGRLRARWSCPVRRDASGRRAASGTRPW